MVTKPEGLVDRHFSLGSLVNLAVLITAIVTATLYISEGRATDNAQDERISAVEARQNRDSQETKRWQERVEDKIDAIRADLSTKADRR